MNDRYEEDPIFDLPVSISTAWRGSSARVSFYPPFVASE